MTMTNSVQFYRTVASGSVAHVREAMTKMTPESFAHGALLAVDRGDLPTVKLFTQSSMVEYLAAALLERAASHAPLDVTVEIGTVVTEASAHERAFETAMKRKRWDHAEVMINGASLSEKKRDQALIGDIETMPVSLMHALLKNKTCSCLDPLIQMAAIQVRMDMVNGLLAHGTDEDKAKAVYHLIAAGRSDLAPPLMAQCEPTLLRDVFDQFVRDHARRAHENRDALGTLMPAEVQENWIRDGVEQVPQTQRHVEARRRAAQANQGNSSWQGRPRCRP